MTWDYPDALLRAGTLTDCWRPDRGLLFAALLEDLQKPGDDPRGVGLGQPSFQLTSHHHSNMQLARANIYLHFAFLRDAAPTAHRRRSLESLSKQAAQESGLMSQ